MRVKRGGVWIDIETGPDARKKAAEQRAAEQKKRDSYESACEQIRGEVVAHLLNRACSKIIDGNLAGAVSTLRTARQIQRKG